MRERLIALQDARANMGMVEDEERARLRARAEVVTALLNGEHVAGVQSPRTAAERSALGTELAGLRQRI